MRQETLAGGRLEKYRKKTRREQFLEEIERIIPWTELAAVIEPFYPQPEGAGRRPIGIERMLWIHFLQHWFNLSDPAAKETPYDPRAMRRFVGIDLGREPVPDETTICKFRHLLEAHNLGEHRLPCLRPGFRFGLVQVRCYDGLSVFACDDGYDLDADTEASPLKHPLLEEASVIALHELEASAEVWLNPAVDVLQAFRKHP